MRVAATWLLRRLGNRHGMNVRNHRICIYFTTARRYCIRSTVKLQILSHCVFVASLVVFITSVMLNLYTMLYTSFSALTLPSCCSLKPVLMSSIVPMSFTRLGLTEPF